MRFSEVFATRPLLRRRLKLRLQNNYDRFIRALVVWLLWAAISLILVGLFSELGIYASLLLLGAVVLFYEASAYRGLRQNLRREMHWEARWQHDFTSRMAPKLRGRRALPVWVSYMARPDLLELAWQTIVDERPKHVLELGSGMSTLVMAYALENAGGGDLIALEDHPGIASNTRERLAEHELAEYVRVLHAPLQSLKLEGEAHHFYSLKELPDDRRFDMVFVDGPGAFLDPKIRYPAMPLLRKRLAENVVILIDDMDRAAEQRIVQRWLADYPELQKDEVLSTAGHFVLRLKRQIDSGD